MALSRFTSWFRKRRIELAELQWNPHTCGCAVTYRQQVVRRLKPEVIPYGSGDAVRLVERFGDAAGRLRLLVDDADDRLLVQVPRYETAIEEMGRPLWRRQHDLAEMLVTPGRKVRATIKTPCPRHLDVPLTSEMLLITARVPAVCKCEWRELRIEDDESGYRLFGRRMYRLCLAHAEAPYAHIPELVLAEAKQLPKPRYHRIEYKIDEAGSVWHCIELADGRVFRLQMEQLETAAP